jgi:hypothetical protein
MAGMSFLSFIATGVTLIDWLWEEGGSAVALPFFKAQWGSRVGLRVSRCDSPLASCLQLSYYAEHASCATSPK